MVAQEAHAHEGPHGFIRKYIFSLDHKVIGLQYFFLALTAVFVGMFLSLLMRIHMIWPTADLPLFGRDQAGDLSQPADHARHHHGVLRADHGTAGWVWQLFPAHSDWCAGYGVSGAEYALVLDNVCCLRGNSGGILCDRRASPAWLDRVCPAERADQFRARRTARGGLVDYEHCHLLYRVPDGGA